jgi:hypothetical protein
MAKTTFSGPVTSNAGFNSDDTLTPADLHYMEVLIN